MDRDMGPIIHLEIEGIRERVHHGLMTQAHAWDEYIKGELDHTLSDGRVAEMVRDSVRREVDAKLRESIKRYFQHGEGGKAIEAMTEKMLNNNLTGEENEPTENR